MAEDAAWASGWPGHDRSSVRFTNGWRKWSCDCWQ